MQIRHVMIATDFSGGAKATHVHAAAIARLTGARVTVLTVNEAFDHDFRSYRWMAEYLGEADRERQRLVEGCEVELQSLEVRPTMQIRVGDAAKEICAHAREHRVDLVLMGQRGLRDVERLLLGRTVRRTLRRADVPVMVVPPDGQSSELPSYGRLLAAVDFSRAARLGLKASIDLAVALDAQVEVMYVVRIPVTALLPNADKLDGWSLMLPEENRNELSGKLRQAVKEARGLEGAARCRCTVTAGFSVAETIVGAARKTGSALITIPTGGRRSVRDVIFGSTTESVLRLTSVPVVVFPVEHLVGRFDAETQL